MQKKTKLVRTLSAVGTVGYVGSFLQWMWVLILYLPVIVTAPLFKQLMPGGDDVSEPVINPAPASSAPIEMHPIVSWLVLFLGVILVLVLVYFMVTRITRSVSKAGEIVTHKPAIILGDVLASRVPLKAKQKRQLSANVIFFLKLFMTLVPFLLLIPVPLVILNATPFEVVMAVGVMLVTWSLLAFVTQYSACRLLKVPYTEVR